MSFDRALKERFSGAMREREFVRRTYRALHALGFDGPNGFACVGVCRDELTRPLVDIIEEIWGEAFNFSSLAGMLFLGRTGFLAAQQHAPQVGGRERYVFFALPHIALDERGQPGVCARPGRDDPGSACGALLALRENLAEGNVDLSLDPDDMEQSLLRRRLVPLIHADEVPSLIGLTRLAETAIREDLERMLANTVDPERADHAVLTGIQVHGPTMGFVCPGVLYAVIRGEKKEIRLE